MLHRMAGVVAIASVLLSQSSTSAQESRASRASNPLAIFRVFFATGSSFLSTSARATLVRVLDVSKQLDHWRVEITGHTDSEGSEELNDILARARADAVQDELIVLGIDPARINSQSYGSSRPFVTVKQGQPELLNRRVEVTFFGEWPDPREANVSPPFDTPSISAPEE